MATHRKLPSWRGEHHCYSIEASLLDTLSTPICHKAAQTMCLTCNKLMGKPYRAPDPHTLPKVCVTESPPPFTVTGVDFTGALYIKES